MGLMGTLAKVAIGYAAAKGVDRLSGGQGLGGLLGGGAQVEGDGTGNPLQNMMGQMMGGEGNPMAAVMEKLQQSGLDLSAFSGASAGAADDGADKGGLLSGMAGAGGALAGLGAAAGGMAAMQGKGLGGLFDSFNTRETAPDAEAAAALMLRAMIQSAKADGGIDETEQAKILEAVGDDAEPDDIAFVKAQLAAPVDVDALAADTPDAQKIPVYSASLMTIRVDTQAEAQYLHALAQGLGLDQQTVNNLHLGAGLQPLYS